MNILICSKLYYPNSSIGAVRPTNFSNYLFEKGHTITIISAEEPNKQPYRHGIDNITISNSNLIKKIIKWNSERQNFKFNNISKSKNSIKKDLSFTKFMIVIKNICSDLLALIIEIDWYLNAKKKIKLKNYNNYDIVFSTYGPLSSFLLGLFFSKVQKKSKWICDFRDNMQSVNNSFFINFIYKYFEKIAYNRADALTFVSYGQRKMFMKNNNICSDNNKLFVLYNGYENSIDNIDNIDNVDNIDNNYFFNNKLKLVYTGQLYKGQRDFKLLFDVLENLISRRLINEKYIEINYAGPNYEEFINQCSSYKHIMNISNNLGQISKNKAIELQKKSDILLVLTWNTYKEQGVLTGKFFEYLNSKKPIISITSGDLPDSELSQLVQEMSLGIACEYIDYKNSYKKLESFLIQCYNNKLTTNSVQFTGDMLKIKEYSYSNISLKLIQIINNLNEKYEN